MATPLEHLPISRPQPVGLFPFPASHLLLPDDDSPRAAEARRALLAGGIPADLPASWQFLASAAAGRWEQARAEIVGQGPISDYNRCVLSPTAKGAAELAADCSGDLLALLTSALFAQGTLPNTLHEATAAAHALDGELRALALLTAAAGWIEQGEHAAAAEALTAGIAAARAESPVLAALLEMQLADICPRLADGEGTIQQQIDHYRRALVLSADAQLPMLKAELLMKLAGALQQRAAGGDRAGLVEAIEAYHRVLQAGVSRQAHPEWFAQVHSNLGLAYLTMPAREASDQLRVGIAVQSFRQALEVFDRESHPDQWASAMMNLANALQYAPSSHPRENLIQAVETYEEILPVRTRARDPVAYALVLFNQANALAHLGIFKPAIEKLAEASKLFSWHDQAEQFAAARALLDSIEERLEAARCQPNPS